MLELILLGGFAAYNMATTHSDSHESQQGDRKIGCYDIWQQITTGPGAGAIAESQGAASRLKGVYSERLGTIDALAKEMDAAWTGGGAEAAQQAGAHPLKVWMEDSGKKLGESDKYLGEQHTSFTTVHTQVQEVPKDPPKNNLFNAMKPWTTDTDRAIRDYNTKGQANVDAFNTYFKASNDNGQKMPTYAALDGQKESVGVNGGDDGKGKDDGKKKPNGSDDRPGIDQPGFKPGDVPGMNDPRVPGTGGLTPPKVPGGDYTTPKIPGGGDYNTPKIPGSDYTPPKWDDGTHSSGYTPPKIPGGSFPGGGGFGPGGGGGGGAGDFSMPGAGGDFGPGGSGFGPGGGAGFGPGGSSGAAVPGSAGRGGVGGAMGGGAGGGAGTGAGSRGSTGMGGMGGMGQGGKGKGGEDDERTSKYLLGDDPNDIFGSDELTAPPVIGE